MPHYLTPLSSVTTVTTCRLEGSAPRRPRARSVSGPCSCGSCPDATEDPAAGSRELPAPLQPPGAGLPKREQEAKPEDPFSDVAECSAKDESSDGSSMDSDAMEVSSLKVEINDESSKSSDTFDDSPLKSDLSSDISTKSALSGDFSNMSVKEEDKSDETDEESALPDAPRNPGDGSSVSMAVPSEPVSAERLQAAAEVIGKCGEGSSTSRRRSTPQPRDFSRERPAGFKYIRRAVKRSRPNSRPRSATASPKRKRSCSPGCSDLMKTTFYP